jgi:hypothetical protein
MSRQPQDRLHPFQRHSIAVDTQYYLPVLFSDTVPHTRLRHSADHQESAAQKLTAPRRRAAKFSTVALFILRVLSSHLVSCRPSGALEFSEKFVRFKVDLCNLFKFLGKSVQS